MGRIRIKEIKKVAFELIEKCPDKFTDDFEKNKENLKEMDLIEDKKVRNKIAGYVTRLVKSGKLKKL